MAESSFLLAMIAVAGLLWVILVITRPPRDNNHLQVAKSRIPPGERSGKGSIKVDGETPRAWGTWTPDLEFRYPSVQAWTDFDIDAVKPIPYRPFRSESYFQGMPCLPALRVESLTCRLFCFQMGTKVRASPGSGYGLTRNSGTHDVSPAIPLLLASVLCLGITGSNWTISELFIWPALRVTRKRSVAMRWGTCLPAQLSQDCQHPKATHGTSRKQSPPDATRFLAACRGVSRRDLLVPLRPLPVTFPSGSRSVSRRRCFDVGRLHKRQAGRSCCGHHQPHYGGFVRLPCPTPDGGIRMGSHEICRTSVGLPTLQTVLE